MLLTFPWVALSWYYKQQVNGGIPPPAQDEETPSATEVYHLDAIIARTCALTALTMMIFGGGQVLRRGAAAIDTTPKLDSNSAKGALLRVLSIALPIYATLKVGGFLVALTALLAVASGVPTLPQGPASQQGHVRLSQRKLTVGCIVGAILLNYLGLSPSLEPQRTLGYLALFVSIFVLRPPFSGATSELSGLGGGISESEQKAAAGSSTESVLTALSGLLLGIATLIFGSVSIDSSHLLQLLAVAAVFSLSLVFLAPADVRSPQKIGLAVSTGVAALMCAPPSQYGVQVAYLFRCTLAVISFFISRFDDSSLRLNSHSHGHHHGHQHSEASRISKLVIQYSEPYPLLYSIVKESDSRRIFYFMRYDGKLAPVASDSNSRT